MYVTIAWHLQAAVLHKIEQLNACDHLLFRALHVHPGIGVH